MSPCQACGACCATYRVSFRSEEVDDMQGGRVPAALVERITDSLACMSGTAGAPPRCIALHGRIGEAVSCVIYEFRPDACREFAPLAAVGHGDEACTEARQRHRLAPLTPVRA